MLGLGGVPGDLQPCGPAGLGVCRRLSSGGCGCWFGAAPLPAGLPAARQLLREQRGSMVAAWLRGGSVARCPRGSGWGSPCDGCMVGAMCTFLCPRQSVRHCLPAAAAALPVGRGDLGQRGQGHLEVGFSFCYFSSMRELPRLLHPSLLRGRKHQPSASREGGTFFTQRLCAQPPALHPVCCAVTCHRAVPVPAVRSKVPLHPWLCASAGVPGLRAGSRSIALGSERGCGGAGCQRLARVCGG